MTTSKKPRARKPRAKKSHPITVADMRPIQSTVIFVSNEEMLARHPPQYSKGVLCAICFAPLDDFFSHYSGAVCRDCDGRALNEEGNPARHACDFPDSIEYSRAHPDMLIDFGDDGDNPVFIGGHKCWRRYKFGGWMTVKE